MKRIRATIQDIWEFDGTRWVELLLASVKVALGVGILLSLGSPAVQARYGSIWAVVGLVLGLFLSLLGLVQALGVLLTYRRVRIATLLVGTSLWTFYPLISLVLGAAPQSQLIYVPLIVVNILAIKRLAWPSIKLGGPDG